MPKSRAPKSERNLADGWVILMAMVWKYVMVRKYRVNLKRMLDAAWAMEKALV